jgi:hypothetical protein
MGRTYPASPIDNRRQVTNLSYKNCTEGLFVKTGV